MKRSIIFILLAVLGGLALYFFTQEKSGQPSVTVQTATEAFDENLSVRVLHDDTVVTMNLQEYLVGVVSAEMPQDFPLQAQQAQAIAARTFALCQAQRQKHAGADICTNASCCQSWQAEGNSRARSAVEQTDGLVITYENELIEATYFSCCGTRTEAALAVWGSDIPYLQSVSSEGEESAPRYRQSVTVRADDFAAQLREHNSGASLQGTPQSWFGRITYTKGGGIDTVVIGGVAFTGIQLRRIFSLRSTDITFDITDDAVTMITCGYGHRVGMSQYGARAMAESGCHFEEILTHYYQNVQIHRLYT